MESEGIVAQRTVAVFGAYGHTGRFVVDELRKRGVRRILSGRDGGALHALAAGDSDSPVRPATLDDGASLDRALAGADAVINCAGPFASTAGPVIDAALRARIPYLDLAAEIEANMDTFANYERRARDASIVILPAMAFYGGLGDLLATAAAGDWPHADEITIAYGLDSWKPTAGTRAAGGVSRARRNGRRVVFTSGSLEYRTDSAPQTRWTFPEPLGDQDVIAEFTTADSVTIARHVAVPRIHSYITMSALKDLRDESCPPPVPVDEDGRSAQTFLVDVVVRRRGEQRRASARGRDIYAVSAPLVVEAAERLMSSHAWTPGIYTAGELFDAHDFLSALSPGDFRVDFSSTSSTTVRADRSKFQPVP